MTNFDAYHDTLRKLLATVASLTRLTVPDEQIKVIFGPTQEGDPRLGGAVVVIDPETHTCGDGSSLDCRPCSETRQGLGAARGGIRVMVHGGQSPETDEKVLRAQWLAIVELWNTLPQSERDLEWRHWQPIEVFDRLALALVDSGVLTPEQIMKEVDRVESGG